jgi:hypothetical protein
MSIFWEGYIADTISITHARNSWPMHAYDEMSSSFPPIYAESP